MRYYRHFYYHGDKLEILDENLKKTETISVISDSFGNWLYETTGLPATDETMVEVVKRTDVVGALKKTEPIEGTEYEKVLGMLEMDEKDIKAIHKNLEIK